MLVRSRDGADGPGADPDPPGPGAAGARVQVGGGRGTAPLVRLPRPPSRFRPAGGSDRGQGVGPGQAGPRRHGRRRPAPPLPTAAGSSTGCSSPGWGRAKPWTCAGATWTPPAGPGPTRRPATRHSTTATSASSTSGRVPGRRSSRAPQAGPAGPPLQPHRCRRLAPGAAANGPRHAPGLREHGRQRREAAAQAPARPSLYRREPPPRRPPRRPLRLREGVPAPRALGRPFVIRASDSGLRPSRRCRTGACSTG